MYREGVIYDTIDKIIIDIYLDYGVRVFPIDDVYLCEKMGIEVIPYSNFGIDVRGLMKKKSKDGFFQKATNSTPPIIYYNDFMKKTGCIRMTKFHEMFHYVNEDTDDSNDDLAEYFARHIMCPTPYLLLKGIETAEEIEKFCNVSKAASRNAASNIKNRKEKYGKGLFEWEVPLIEHLEPDLLDLDDVYIIKKEVACL